MPCLPPKVAGGARRAGVLRCAGKAGNPFQTTQGNHLSCRDQEARRGSEEVVPGPSVFPSGDPGGTFFSLSHGRSCLLL